MGKVVKDDRKSKNKSLQKKIAKNTKSNSSTNPNRKTDANSDGKNNSFRTKATINRLNMYNEKPDKKKMYERPKEMARVEPNRKWFGNVKTIDQKAMEKLRIEMAQKKDNPKHLLIRQRNIPIGLLSDPIKENKMKLLEIETYADTFGPQSRRKRVRTNTTTLEEFAGKAEEKLVEVEIPKTISDNDTDMKEEARDKRLSAGQSKRIWEELHKVIDSSDVLVQILDARDPQGTRSKALEEHLKKNCPHKHVVLILNKCDLVPVWVTLKWVKHLSKEYPTIAFKSSITNPYGKGSLINLFRQFVNFHKKDKKSISIGFVGYPNVGKSSVINTLKEKKVCKSAPIPGETKVWQYIQLSKFIYLIDCPGVVHYTEGKNDVNSVLKGCVRAEKIDDPCYYIPYVLEKVKVEHIKRIYGLEEWKDDEDFLEKLSFKKGKLKKGAEADVVATAKIVLMDWQRGELPFFSLPPGAKDEPQGDVLKKEEAVLPEEEEIQEENEDEGV